MRKKAETKIKSLQKGSKGYLAKRKKQAAVIVAFFAVLILALIIVGILLNGSNKNLLTLIAIVLVLPGAKFAVNLIVISPHKPVSEELFKEVETNARFLTRLYDNVIGTTERPVGAPAIAYCDNALCIYTDEEKTNVDFLTKQVKNFLQGDSIFINVSVYTDEKQFVKRIANLNSNIESSTKKPIEGRDEKIRASLETMLI